MEDLEILFSTIMYTDIEENQIFLIYKEIQNRAVAKSYITNGLIIYGEMNLQLLHSEFPYIWENIIFI